MTDDIKAIRDALAAAKKEAPPWARLEQAAEFWCVANPERIARLLDALEAATKDAERYRWLRSRQVECTPHVAIAEHAAERFDRHIDAAMKGTP